MGLMGYLLMEGKTTIPIEAGVRDDLRAAKEGGETYSQVIARLLENRE